LALACAVIGASNPFLPLWVMASGFPAMEHATPPPIEIV
jgi:hypothetical protein